MAFTIQTASAVIGLASPGGTAPFPDTLSTIGLEEAATVIGTYPLLINRSITVGAIATNSRASLLPSIEFDQTVTIGSIVTNGRTAFGSTLDGNIDVTVSAIITSSRSSHDPTVNFDQTVTLAAIAANGRATFNPTVNFDQTVTVGAIASNGRTSFNGLLSAYQTITVLALATQTMSSHNPEVTRGYPSYTLADVRTTMPVSINGTTYVVDFQKFARQNAQTARTSSDEGGDPFERSIADEQLWKRTGYNWELGAGQDYWDRRESDRSRFRYSLGVNPFDEGKLKLYAGATAESESNIDDMVVAGDYLYCLSSTAVRRIANKTDTFASVTGLAASGLASITTDGNLVWVSDGTQIESFSGTGGATPYSTFNAHLVGYANGRLLATDTAAKGTLYEIQDGGSTSTLIWAHPNTAFEWKLIVPSPQGIYVVGDAGGQSEVYKITVADNTGDLIPPYSAVSMEAGEIIKDMVSYGGLMLGTTTRGFRLFNVADASGHLTYGKAIAFDNTNGGGGIATRGEDVYCGWGGHTFTDASGSTITSSGVAHVRLTEFIDTLVPPYAMGPAYRSAATSDDVVAVAYYDDQIFWSVDGTLYSDQANSAVGYMEVGNLEFGSVDEDKRMVAATLVTEPLPASTQVDLEILDVGGTATTVVSSSATSATAKRTLVASEIGERWRVFATLTPSGASNPVVERWSIEAIPSPTHAEDVVFPVMLFDEVEDELTETTVAYNVLTSYQALKALAESREIITVLVGDQTMTGFVYDVALPRGDAGEWTNNEEYVEGTYHVFFRTVES